MKALRTKSLYILFPMLVLCRPLVATAQEYKAAPAAPVPPEILSANVIFIANGGGEESPLFSGGPDRAYNQFYAAMKSWGRYKLASLSDNAGLLFEVQFVLAPFSRTVFHGDSEAQSADPQLRLVIRNAKTQALLWRFTEHVEWAALQSNRDKNFDEALAKIVESLETLAAGPAAPATKPR